MWRSEKKIWSHMPFTIHLGMSEYEKTVSGNQTISLTFVKRGLSCSVGRDGCLRKTGRYSFTRTFVISAIYTVW